MVRAATGFHGDLFARELREERNHLSATEIHPQRWSVVLVDAM
jgi:hypothetical protein